MAGKPVKNTVSAFGITALLSNHPKVRRLKRKHAPDLYGSQTWSASWLLMDYLSNNRPASGLNVMEIGCGWCLTGIFCARSLNATVTGVDIDPEVFPFLDLHAGINRVTVSKRVSGFNGVSINDLKSVDILIGSDICFWDSMVLPLKLIINRALRAGVKLILMADPGREPFGSLCDQFLHRKCTDQIDWQTVRPRKIHGRILKIESNNR